MDILICIDIPICHISDLDANDQIVGKGKTMIITPHLNVKFLSTKSSWDFEGSLDTIKPN